MLKEWENAYRLQYKAYPFFTSVYVLASTTKFKSKYSIFWNDFLNNFEDGQVTAFKQNKKLLKTGKIIIKETLALNNNYFNDLKKLHLELRRVIIECEKHDNQDNAYFEKIWIKISLALSHAANLLFSFDYPFDDFLSQLRIKNQKSFEYITENIKNNRNSFMSEASSYLLKLDRENKNFEIVFNKFKEKFSWFQNTYSGPTVITEQWLKKYLSDLKLNLNKKSEKLIKRDRPNEYNPLIKLASYAAIVRDDKKKLLLLAVRLMDSWLKSICKKHKLDYKDLRWLTVDEIKNLIFKQKDFYLRAAKRYEANKSRLGLMASLGYNDVSVDVWKEVLKMNESEESNVLRGIPASAGVYKGKVKVVLDINKVGTSFKKGEILATSMTRPEYLSLMSKAGAFVTEEGGISCHAAIVAREMKKPCVIGVKNVTKFLKDGDIVIVDGVRGLIKKEIKK